jgi:hypothetical protein
VTPVPRASPCHPAAAVCNKSAAVPVSFVYGSRDWMDPQHAHALAPRLAVPASVSRASCHVLAPCVFALLMPPAGARCVEQRAPHVRARATSIESVFCDCLFHKVPGKL